MNCCFSWYTLLLETFRGASFLFVFFCRKYWLATYFFDKKLFGSRTHISHSQMEHYFFSYLLTCEVYLIKVLEIMAQILQYITFLSLKAIKVSSDFILNYLKKVVGGATTQKYQKQMLKPWYFLYGSAPRGSEGIKRCARIH